MILVPLEEISNSLLGGKGAGLTFVVYGAIIVVIARFLPSGLLALFSGSPRKKPLKPEPQAAPQPEPHHAA
jgi:branched-chain amino acid transport system permease protein